MITDEQTDAQSGDEQDQGTQQIFHGYLKWLTDIKELDGKKKQKFQTL